MAEGGQRNVRRTLFEPDQEVENLRLKMENDKLKEEVKKLNSEHGIVLVALVRLQGLLCQFKRGCVRLAFLGGVIGNVESSLAVLESLDSLSAILLPRPSALVATLGDDLALKFIFKLLTRDLSEPTDKDGHSLKHRMSFAEWRQYLNAIRMDRIWDDIPNCDGASSVAPSSPNEKPSCGRRFGCAADELLSELKTSNSSDERSRDRSLKPLRSPTVRLDEGVTSSASESSSSSGTDFSIDRKRTSRARKRGPVFPKQIITPAKFDPLGTDSLRRYLRTYERYFNAKYDASEREKASHLGQFLQGNVRRAYDAMGGSKVKYYMLKPKLLKWFASERVDSQPRKQEEFVSFHRDKGDTLAIHCMRLEQLSVGVFPNERERLRQLCRKLRQTSPTDFLLQLESAEGALRVIGNGKLTWSQMKKVAATYDKNLQERCAEARALDEEDLSIYFNSLDHASATVGYCSRAVDDTPSSGAVINSDNCGGNKFEGARPEKEERGILQGDESHDKSQFRKGIQQTRRRFGHEKHCAFCDRTGHTVDDCFRMNRRCFGCGDSGHIFRDCARRWSDGDDANGVRFGTQINAKRIRSADSLNY